MKMGSEEILNNFYEKKPNSKSVEEFTNHLQEIARDIFKDGKRIDKPHLVEVILSISMTEKNFMRIDVDNICKCILDALKNIAFEDDSQVVSLIANKHVNPMKLNALMVGITKLTDERKGFRGEMSLFSSK